jgi:hypothetical protein
MVSDTIWQLKNKLIEKLECRQLAMIFNSIFIEINDDKLWISYGS